MLRVLYLLFGCLLIHAEELKLEKPSPIPAPEAKELLKAVCSGPIGLNSGSWGCTTCPRFTSPPAHLPWDLERIYYGHFTDPSADEAVLAMSGCAPHTLQFGGTVLLRRDHGVWRMRWSKLGLITNRCLKVDRAGGREILLCESEEMHQGIGELSLFSADLAKPSTKRQTIILYLTENMNTCGENVGAMNAKLDPLQTAQFFRIDWDQSAKLKVDVRYGWRLYTEANSKACRAAQKAEKPLPPTLAPKTADYTIEYDFDGEKFRLDRSSAQAKRIIETNHLRRR